MVPVHAIVTIKHTVKGGETLSGIAFKNRTTIAEIRQRSGLGKDEKLKLGTVLTIALNTVQENENSYSLLTEKKLKTIKGKKFHTLDTARIARAKNIKPKVVVQKKIVQAVTEGGQRQDKKLKTIKSKKFHTLDTARITHAKNIKPKVVVQKKIVQAVTEGGQRQDKKLKTIKSKKFHTLDTARIARVKNIKPKVVVQKKKKNIGTARKKKIVKIVKQKNTRAYAVQNGDTLFSIARKHGMTVSALLKANDVEYQETLKLGQTFKVASLAEKIGKKKKIQKVVKKVKKVKKNTKEKKTLHTALTQHTRPLRKKRNRVTVDDIFFKSSQPNILLFSNNNSSKKITNIINVAKTKLGRKYVWGAVGQRGTFDCSGFTSYVFRKNGINIPRTSLNQSKYGKYVTRANLKKGDLIFFDTSKRRKGYVNHVGIYLGNGQFIHASSAKKKVVVSNLSKFYSQRYKGARRPS